MKKFFFVTFLILSCPKPEIKKIPESDYLKAAQCSYQNNPLYAHNILKNFVVSAQYINERSKILVKIYLDQREYDRAAALLDSINRSIDLSSNERDIILFRTEQWDRLVQTTADTLLKGIAYYYLGENEKAIEFLSKPLNPNDYRMMYLARTYERVGDFCNAFNVLIAIDQISTYLNYDYQELLFKFLLNLNDFDMVQRELKKLNKPPLRKFILLKIYERQKDQNRLEKTAWELIRMYPKSEGAYYALQLIKPKTKSDHKSFGKGYYYHGDYDGAIRHFRNARPDDTVNYYMGMSYYNKEEYARSLNYLSLSNWPAAYYYCGRIYENFKQFEKALAIYDSLYQFHKNSEYAMRGLKRKAFLLEDIGDTLKAVETFLKIDERNTQFRAAMQLFRIGALDKADSILSVGNEPAFIYWRIRIKERLGTPDETLKNLLIDRYPVSYYTLVRGDKEITFDTTALDIWMRQLGDSLISFNTSDSLHLLNARRYFHLNEPTYAVEELEMIRDKSPQDLLYLSKLCSQYGADKQSILYSLQINKIAQKNNLHKMPFELVKLIYPVRYAFTIAEQGIDLDLCLAMIWQESLFDPRACSWANAQGIMQIIPSTAKRIARGLDVQSYSLYDPSVSITFGCYYFLSLLNDLNSVPLSLAGYNAGPIRVKRWIEQNPNHELDEFIDLIPYNETRNYVKSILSRQVIYKKLLGI